MMQSIQWILLRSCLLGVFIPFSRTSVVLEIVGGKTTFPEGSKVELLCTISSYNNLMTWYVDNDVYAGCLAGSCAPSANKEYTFIFEFYQSSKNFTLTIESVNSSHAALVFACDDGNERKTKTFTVTTVNKPSESDEPANNKLRDELIALGVVIGIIVIIVIIVIITLICVRPKLTNIKLEDTKIHLEWTDCLNCCGCCQRIFGYSIVCKPKHGQETEINKENVTKEKQYTLETLDPMAIYEICLCRKFWCFRSFAQRIYVITRKLGMLNDQGNNAKPNSIDVRWTEPDCITNAEMKYKVTCNEKVTEENTGEIKSKIKGLFPKKTYTIKVFAIDNGINSLLFAEEITTTDLKVKVNLRDVCYQPGESYVECNIKWTIDDVVIPEHEYDIPDHLDESNTVYFNVKCYLENQVVHKKEMIRVSRYTIPKLYPNRSYSVYVYPVYHSITFTPAVIDLTTPYKPTWEKVPEAKSTEIELKWKKPEYTGTKQLKYEVTCDGKIVPTTTETSCKIKDLEPDQSYNIQIFTIINKEHGMKSLPLQRKIKTQPSQQVPFPEIQLGAQNVNLVSQQRF